MPSAQEPLLQERRWLADTLERARAEAAAGVVAAEDHLRIAGREVLVRYADAGMRELLGRATSHLRGGHLDRPALTIDCWSTTGKQPTPPAGWPSTGTIHMDGGSVVVNWDLRFGTLRAYDSQRRHAWTRFDHPADAATWEAGGPFRRIFNWWAPEFGLLFMHAAAVGRPDGGVLLVGRSGSGKSTTALACLAAGLDFAGDDSCLIESAEAPWAHGLYVSAKGDARTSNLVPVFADEFARSPIKLDGDSVIFVDQVRPNGVASGFPLRGIVVPKLSAEGGELTRIGPAAALRALAPSTLTQLPGGDRVGGLARMASIVQELPTWELPIGPNPADAAELIKGLVGGRSSR